MRTLRFRDKVARQRESIRAHYLDTRTVERLKPGRASATSGTTLFQDSALESPERHQSWSLRY